MTSPTASAILAQVDATLRLIRSLSLSLSPNEIIEIRQGLAYAYDSIGVVLEERNLRVEGFTSVCEFGANSLDSIFTFSQHR